MPVVIVGLGIAARFIVAFALRWLWITTVGALMGYIASRLISVSVLHGHPLRSIGRAIERENRFVENLIAKQALAAEAAVIALFLGIGHQLERAGNELAGFAAAVVASVTGVVVTLPGKIADGAKAWATTAAVAAIAATVRLTTIALHGVQRRVGALERAWHAQLNLLARGIDRVRTTVTRTIPKELGRIRTRVGRLERRVASQAFWKSRIRAIAGTAFFAAAVGTALSRLGLRWMRCPSFGRLGKRIGCNGFSFLEALMFVPLVAIGLQEMCSLVRPIQQAALAFEPLLIGFVNEVQGFVCGGREAAATGITDYDFAPVTLLPTGIVPEDLQPLDRNRLAA